MAKTATYSLISSATGNGSSSSITFSSIPATYTDLILVTNTSVPNSASQLRLQMNSDTGANYSSTYLYGTGTTGASARDSNRSWMDIGATFGSNGSVWAPNIIHIMDYANTTTYKTAISRFAGGTGATLDYVEAAVSLWRNTSAISTIAITTNGTYWNTGSTFKLYGIEAYK
jgi:hypothetical protein